MKFYKDSLEMVAPFVTLAAYYRSKKDGEFILFFFIKIRLKYSSTVCNSSSSTTEAQRKDYFAPLIKTKQKIPVLGIQKKQTAAKLKFELIPHEREFLVLIPWTLCFFMKIFRKILCHAIQDFWFLQY